MHIVQSRRTKVLQQTYASWETMELLWQSKPPYKWAFTLLEESAYGVLSEKPCLIHEKNVPYPNIIHHIFTTGVVWSPYLLTDYFQSAPTFCLFLYFYVFMCISFMHWEINWIMKLLLQVLLSTLITISKKRRKIKCFFFFPQKKSNPELSAYHKKVWVAWNPNDIDLKWFSASVRYTPWDQINPITPWDV